MFSIMRSVKLKPFLVPNYVIADEGFPDEESESFPLKDVDPMVLSAMCDGFREEVFRKALKQDPRLK
jgi:hypothetical protein